MPWKKHIIPDEFGGEDVIYHLKAGPLDLTIEQRRHNYRLFCDSFLGFYLDTPDDKIADYTTLCAAKRGGERWLQKIARAILLAL
jgi:hypothetical protein